MTKPTQEQVEQCDDVNQLHEWAAVYCFGAEKINKCSYDIDGFPYHLTKNVLIVDSEVLYEDFTPCHPTTEGKAQAYDLGIKFDVFPYKNEESGLWEVNYGIASSEFFNALYGVVEHENPQIAQVKAAIISAVSE